MTSIVGFFERDDQQYPSYDPGLSVSCPICMRALAEPVKTISLMPMAGDSRSLFFRTHKHCWEAASAKEQSEIEGAIIDGEAKLQKIPAPAEASTGQV